MELVDLLYIGLAASVVAVTAGITAFAAARIGKYHPRPACLPVRTSARRSRRHLPH